jgi:phospholipase C
MDVRDRGFSFQTFHEPAGDVAHVRAAYRRFQTQAPIRRTQKFELEFFGRGAGMELGVMALPRRATPQAMMAVRRERAAAVRTMHVATTATTTTATPTIPATTRILARANREAPATPAAPATSATSPEATAPAISTRSTVSPDFQSPFDRDWIDWDLEPPDFPDPTDPPGGGGGGGGGSFHSQVLLELFIFGADQPVQTWLLEEGVGPRIRRVKFEILGFPSPDSPMLRTGWWRMVATPIGPDPVEIEITADVSLGDVPIRTTPLAVRLANHLFRVALEALVPNAEVDGSTARVSIGREIAELLDTEPLLLSEGISPATSNAKLRSLDITTISGAELHTIAREHYKERAKRTPFGAGLSDEQLEQLAAVLFKSRFLRLGLVQPDYVCIRIQAAFSNASVSVSGFDVASLRGELGEFIIAFDRTLTRVLPFSFLDVKFSTLASIAIDIINLFTEVPSNVNALIEQLLSAQERHILKYVRLFVGRAVGLNSFVHEFKLQNGAWRIRHSDDPVIPRPGDPVLPPFGGGPLDGGVIAMMARGGVFGEMPSVPLAEVPAPPSSSAVAAALPPGFLPPPEKLALLDQHQSVVVVMMENRSYDHLLGDLMNARPRTTNAYDGAPTGIQNAGVAGFLRGVPTVRTRELHIGTAIPVSPAHGFHPVQFQIGDGTEEGRSTGDMKGFARDLYRRTDSPQLALTVYGEADLPVYYKLADEFCVCDRWFAAHPGPTWPNRFATIMGRIPELDNFDIDDPRIGYLKFRNLFDALTGAGIDWRVFESDLSLVRMFDRYRLDDRHVVPIDDKDDGLEATLRRPGPLPRVMFVEPNFTDIPPLTTANDDLPPTDLKHGQAFISRICDLIWDTGRFRDVLLVITYDEHGGFYDHVPPPGSPRGEPRSVAPLIEGGPTFLGVRVPAFVISPFVSAGRAEKTIFDHTSILKTILLHNRSRLGESTLTSFGPRVNEGSDLSAVLDLTTPRQNPVPFVRRRPSRPPSRFGELVDFSSVLEITDSFSSGPPSFTLPGTATPDVSSGERTPRVITITERLPTPPDPEDPGDFHAALARMLRPRIFR